MVTEEAHLPLTLISSSTRRRSEKEKEGVSGREGGERKKTAPGLFSFFLPSLLLHLFKSLGVEPGQGRGERKEREPARKEREEKKKRGEEKEDPYCLWLVSSLTFPLHALNCCPGPPKRERKGGNVTKKESLRPAPSFLHRQHYMPRSREKGKLTWRKGKKQGGGEIRFQADFLFFYHHPPSSSRVASIEKKRRRKKKRRKSKKKGKGGGGGKEERSPAAIASWSCLSFSSNHRASSPTKKEKKKKKAQVEGGERGDETAAANAFLILLTPISTYGGKGGGRREKKKRPKKGRRKEDADHQPFCPSSLLSRHGHKKKKEKGA